MQLPLYAEQVESRAPMILSKPSGHAELATLLEDDYNFIRSNFNVYTGIAMILFVFGVMGILYFVVEESIRATKRGKPKLYFHFWSAMFCVFGIMVYLIYSTPLSENVIFLAVVVLLLLVIIYPVVLVSTAYRTFKRTERNVDVKLFTSPFTAVIPTTLCQFAWQFIMTIFGLFFTGILICYIIYISSNVILVYYFYPLRTLIRGLYTFGAVFYTVVIGAFVLYQFEKSTEIIKLLLYALFHKSINFSLPRWDIYRLTARTEEDEIYHKNYYLMEFRSNALKYGATCATLMMILSLLKLVLSVIVLVIYIYAELLLGELLYERTILIKADIDSILAILPSIIIFILTWLGRGIIFDLPQYSVEAILPYTTKEKNQGGTFQTSDLNKNNKIDKGSEHGKSSLTGMSMDDDETIDYSAFCLWLNDGGEHKGRKVRFRSEGKKSRRGHVRKSMEHDAEGQPLLGDGLATSSRSVRVTLEDQSSNYGTMYLGSDSEESSGSIVISKDSKLSDQKDLEDTEDLSITESRKGSKRSRQMKLEAADGALKGMESVAGGAEKVTAGIGDMVDNVGGDAAGGIIKKVAKAIGGLGSIFGASSKVVKKVSSVSDKGSRKDDDGESKKEEPGGLSEGLGGVGSVATGLGGAANGIGSTAKALGGNSSTVGKISGAAGGVGGVLNGVGKASSGLGSVTKGFGKLSKKESKSTVKDENSKKEEPGGLSQGLGGVGSVATGLGGAANGIGSAAKALGGNSSTVGKISGAAGGVGGVLNGVGKASSGLGSVTKAFGKLSKKESKSTVKDENSKKEEPGGLSEGLGGVGSVATGLGGAANGIGSAATALGGNSSTVSEISGAATGVGGVLNGVGKASSGLSSVTKAFGKLSKKESKSEVKDEKSKKEEPGGLSEGLGGVGSVATGLGGAANGIGSAATALGGNSSTVGKISGAATGVGGVMNGVGKASSGLGSVTKAFGKLSKKESKSKVKDETSKKEEHRGVSEGLEGVGHVTSALGGSISGVGGVVKAIGGDGSTAGKVGGAATGVGEVFKGVGEVSKGLGSISRGFGGKRKQGEEDSTSAADEDKHRKESESANDFMQMKKITKSNDEL